MKKGLLLLSVPVILLTSSTFIIPTKIDPINLASKELTIEINTSIPKLKLIEIPRSYDDLIDAIIWVESRGDTSAYNFREDAVGVLQIRPIMLKEVNRILDLKGASDIYTLEDRWARGKSIEMFSIVLNYYHKDSSYEKIARCWNGGPAGLQKKQTKKYWRKVQKRLNKHESSINRKS